MFNNSTKIMFTLTLISGMMIVISSNSWLGSWMGLEINLLSFIPIMYNNENIFTTEASMKYFLIQALASSIFLFVIVLKSFSENMFLIQIENNSEMLMMLPLLMKIGAAPFHWWFPSVMEGLTWNNCFVMLTLQKIAPFILISYLLKMSFWMITIILMSTIIGSIGGYNQISTRKILTYSSINHMSWMISAMILSETLWILYLMIYSMLTLTIILIMKSSNISFINQIFNMNSNKLITKFILFSTLLSLGGLPPFLGFLPKWLVIQYMVMEKYIMIIAMMVIFSLITLYYYLRVSYSAFLILNINLKWNMKNNKMKTETELFLLTTTVISSLGLLMSSSIDWIY